MQHKCTHASTRLADWGDRCGGDRLQGLSGSWHIDSRGHTRSRLCCRLGLGNRGHGGCCRGHGCASSRWRHRRQGFGRYRGCCRYGLDSRRRGDCMKGLESTAIVSGGASGKGCAGLERLAHSLRGAGGGRVGWTVGGAWSSCLKASAGDGSTGCVLDCLAPKATHSLEHHTHLLGRAEVQGAAARRRSRSAAKAGPRLEPDVMVASEHLQRFLGARRQKQEAERDERGAGRA